MSRRRPNRTTQAETHDPRRPLLSQTAASSASPPGAVLDGLLRFVLVVLIPLRAVASETHTFEVPRWLRLVEAPVGAGPATTFVFFAVILAVTAVVLWVGMRRGTAYRWTGLEAGVGLFILAATVSTLRAGQKHLALIGSLDFLGLLLYCVALRQLLTRPWHLRLLLTVILATGVVVVSKCAHQRLYELPATIEYYEEHKSELTGGGAEGSDAILRAGALHDYEQRLKAMTVSGYVQHPNVLAGYLILVVMTALAVAAARLERRLLAPAVMPLLLAVVGGAIFFWAQSKGAAAACGLAGLVWLLGGLVVRRFPAAPHARLIIVFWVTAALGAASLVMLLRTQPESLGRSMLFRSMYWQGAWRMMVDQGPWGVGADNFGRFFPRYKSVECPEDVDDPHSWVVKAACEHGVLGLAAVLLVFGGFSWRLARGGSKSEQAVMARSPIVDCPPTDQGDGGGSPACAGRYDLGHARPASRGGSVVLWVGGLGAALLAWWLWLCAGTDVNYAVFTLGAVLLPWLAGFVAIALESRNETRFSDEGSPAAVGGICAGLVGFLAHAGIDLPLFYPGASVTFFALMAAAGALRERPRAAGNQASFIAGASGWWSRRRYGRFCSAVAVAGAVGVAAVLLLLAHPSGRLAALLQAARREMASQTTVPPDPSRVWTTYQRAADCYSLDATALGEWVEELIRRADSSSTIETAFLLAEEYQRRDPFNSACWHYLAGLHWTRFRLEHNPADMRKAVEAMRGAVAAYPTSPSRRLRLGDILEELAEMGGSAEVRRAAATELRTALDLDARRVYVSKPHRLASEERTLILERINRLDQP